MTVAACPHCGAKYLPYRLKPHEARCLRNPAVRAVVAGLLDNGDGRAATYRQYDARAHQVEGAPAARALVHQLGTWETVCAAFGLEMERPGNKGGALAKRRTAEAAEMELAAEDAETIARNREEAADRGLAVCAVRVSADGREIFCMLR